MSDVLDLEDFGDEQSLAGHDYPEPGQYHFVITEVDDSRTQMNAIKVTFTALSGTVEGQANKRFDENFWDPDPGSKDGGKFAKKKLARLAMAGGLILPNALGKRVEIDWQDLKFRQVKAAIVPYERKGKNNDRVYKGVELDGLGIWGPHDPAAEHIPVDEDAIQMARDLGQPNLRAASAAEEQKTPADPKEAMRQKAAAAKGANGAGGASGGGTGPTTTPTKPAEGTAPKSSASSSAASAANPAAAAKKDPYANL